MAEAMISWHCYSRVSPAHPLVQPAAQRLLLGPVHGSAWEDSVLFQTAFCWMARTRTIRVTVRREALRERTWAWTRSWSSRFSLVRLRRNTARLPGRDRK